MKITLQLVAAPTVMQPGGYVPVAYKSRTSSSTAEVNVSVEQQGQGWRIELDWECPHPVKRILEETDKFTDAAALMVPAVKDAPWITMGESGKPVEAVLWRADKQAPLRMDAQGMGTMNRTKVPAGWNAQGEWRDGRWHLLFDLDEWSALKAQGQIAIALWRGSDADRGGLKSVSPGWIEV